MKNDEIRQTNRKALPKFLLFAIACVLAGGVIGYASGYGAANGGVAQLAGMLKEAGAFFGARIAPWLMLALAVIWFDYAIAYNARIADNFKTTMKNSAAIAFANVGRSLLVLLFTAIAAYLLWLNPIYCWFLPIIAVALINGQIERVLRKYMSEEDLEMEVEYDKSMND